MIFKKFGGTEKQKGIKRFIKIMESCKPLKKFAWSPVELANEDFVWFQHYYELKHHFHPTVLLPVRKLDSTDRDILKDILYWMQDGKAHSDEYIIANIRPLLANFLCFDDYLKYDVKIDITIIFNKENIEKELIFKYKNDKNYLSEFDESIMKLITDDYIFFVDLLLTYARYRLQQEENK